MRKITKENAEKLIKSTLGQFFAVSFVKADGTYRDMTCRLHVRKGVKSKGLPYDPSEMDLLPVFDVQKREYRMVNLNTLTRVVCNGQTFAVV